MHGWLRALATIASAGVLTSASISAAAPPRLPLTPAAAAPAPYRAGEVLVRFKAGVDQGRRIATLTRHRLRFRKALPLRGTQLVALPSGTGVSEAVAALARDPRVEAVQPNYVRTLAAVPSDPLFAYSWGLRNTGQSVAGITGTADADVDADEAWDVTTGSAAVTVAVVDTGINPDSPELQGRLVQGYDFVPSPSGDADPTDPTFHSHGTWVAGVMAASPDGVGMAGMDWNARIMPLRVFDEQGLTTTDRIVSAYHYAADHGARIVNASFAGPVSDPVEKAAIAAHPDVLFVAAAGNTGADLDGGGASAYPCAYDLANVLCVAGTDQDDQLASFSNRGVVSVDVAAPGKNILATGVKAGSALFSDGFGAPTLPKWTPETVQGGAWGRDSTMGNEAAGSLPDSLTDSPVGDYLPSTNSWARVKVPLDLTGERACHVTYDVNLALDTATSSGDVFNVESIVTASEDPPPVGDTGWVVDAGYGGGSNTPSGTTWEARTTELPGLNGAEYGWLRFRLVSDADMQVRDGVHVDNVVVRCAAPASSYVGEDDEYVLVEGTSFAAPLVSGVASLLLSVDPTLTPVEVRDRIVATSDPVPALAAATVSGGRVNAATAVRMPPAVAPAAVTATGETTATVTATVRPRLQQTDVTLELGTSTAYGHTLTASVAAGQTAQQVTFDVTGLQQGTVYHYRVRAQNAAGVPTGVATGVDQTFTTAEPAPPVTVTPPPPPAPVTQTTGGDTGTPTVPQSATGDVTPTLTPPDPCAGRTGLRRDACQRLRAGLARCASKKGAARTSCERLQRRLSRCWTLRGVRRSACVRLENGLARCATVKGARTRGACERLEKRLHRCWLLTGARRSACVRLERGLARCATLTTGRARAVCRRRVHALDRCTRVTAAAARGRCVAAARRIR
ncbi:MAG: S8 family serine peptidase [Actinomycetota bacterium]